MEKKETNALETQLLARVSLPSASFYFVTLKAKQGLFSFLI
jgi:hypothetical protein